MRVCITAVACALLVGFVTSCKSESEPTKEPTTKPATTAPAGATTMPAAVGVTGEVTVTSGGAPVLHLTLPAGAQAFPGDKTKIVADKQLHELYLWTVPNAKSLDDAASQVPELIKSEFLEFKVAGAKDVKAAGVDAKQLDSAGKEADDGDAGNAEVILFQLGGHTFAACVHGEGDAPALHRAFMMSVLDTAKLP
jgi:hypothetical protein